MKKFVLLMPVMAMMFGLGTISAQNDENQSVYRRSSLALILVDEDGMPQREVIRDAFLNAPMPDKYDDHNVSIRHFNPAGISISDEDQLAFDIAAGNVSEDGNAKKKKGKFGGIARGLAAAALGGSEGSTLIDTANKEMYAVMAHKYMNEQKVPRQLYDRWFRDEDGNFHMELIKERGKYDASVSDVQTAKNSVRGMRMLEDAGEELINNTFVVVCRYRYMPKEEAVAEMSAAATAVADMFGVGGYASLAGSVAGMAAGTGYFVRTTSYLFQIDWNDEIAAQFYNELWDNPEKYENSDMFRLKYIGQETAFAAVKAGIFSNKSDEELVEIATVNATDAVLAKLQKKYDVFKTKTPLISTEPLMAHIGMKEDLSPGDKYEVLEQVIDKETGKTKYNRKTTIRVKKGAIWDNRYMADEELVAQGKSQEINATEFEGNANGLYPGMLIRQIK